MEAGNGRDSDPVGAGRPAPAAVTLDAPGGGPVRFMLFGIGETGPLEELAEALRRCGADRVDVSAWTGRIDFPALIRDLRDAGIQVAACYVPRDGAPEWDRAALAGHVPSGEGPGPLGYRRRLIEDNAYNRRHKLPGSFRRIRWVTIHNTAEPFSALQEGDRLDFRRDGRSVSFHFAVDESSVVQLMPLGIHAWHAGDGAQGAGNLESIGVEICRSQCRGEAASLYGRSERNALALAAALLRRFGLAPADLRTHRDWSGKFCPHRILERDGFAAFRTEVAGLLSRPPDRDERTILAALQQE